MELNNSASFVSALVDEVEIIEWRVTNEAFETLLDFEDISEENCESSSIRRVTRTFERSEFSEVVFEEIASAEIAVPIPILDLNSSVSSRYQTTTEENLTYSVSEEIEIQPGTIANYRLNWYLVSLQGELDIAVGDTIYTTTFSIGTRLRSEMTSLPDGEC